MASNFQPVGTKAVVEGYSDFISQIQGMDRAVQSLGVSLGRLPSPLRDINTNTTNLSKRFTAIGRSVETLDNRLRASTTSIGEAATNFTRASGAMGQFIDQLGGAKAISQATAAGLRSLSTATQHFTTTKRAATQAEQTNTATLGRLGSAFQSLASRIMPSERLIKAVGVSLKITAASVSVLVRALGGLMAALTAVTSGALKRFGDEISRIGNKLIGMGRNIQMFGRNLMFLISLPIAAALGGMVKSAVDFESAMAGVEKTVTLSNTALDNLALGIREMSLRVPLAAGELAGLAEIGGQLGIDTFGGDAVENLLAFTETIAALGVSTTLAKEEAAEALAQLISIMGDSSLDFVTQIESMASSIVNLGNNFATTEPRIVAFALKIAAAANIVGLSQADTLAIATAFTSVGIAAERGGTSVQKVLITMHQAVGAFGDDLAVIAQVSGLTADQFALGWTKGTLNIKGDILTTGDLFARFVEGLGQQADGGIEVLQQLGLGNDRLLQSFLSVAGAQGQITNALKIGRQGYTETGVAIDQYGNRIKAANALEVEAARRYATTASQLTLLKNSWADLGIEIGEFILPVLNQLVTVGRAVAAMIKQMDERWLKLGVGVALFVATLGPATVAFGLFLSSLGSIMAVVGTVISAIAGLASVTGLLVAPFLAAGVAVAGLAIAFAASFDDIMAITNTSMSDLSADLYAWGHDLVIVFAEGMMSALTAVVNALITIGNVIASWLAPGSPPRLLPEIDDWGASTMEEWMRGWAAADFDLFDDIAGMVENLLRSIPIPELDLIPSIMGSRTSIAEIIELMQETGQVSSALIDQLVAGWGPAGQAVAEYVISLGALQQANERVKAAQESLNRTTEKYRNLLKPINKQLDDINDIRQQTIDAMRIEELNAMIADPNASAQVKELARLELKQIALLQEKDNIEEAQAAEEERAQAELDAAKAQQEALAAQTAAEKAHLDNIIENNRLLMEQMRLLERLAETGSGRAAGGDAASPLDLSGISSFDPSGLEDPFDSIGQAMADRVTHIRKQVSQLFEDLKNLPAFQALKDAWQKLGEVWAPIFLDAQKTISRIGEHLQTLTGLDLQSAFKESFNRLLAGDWAGAAGNLVDVLLPDGLPLEDNILQGLVNMDARLQAEASEWGVAIGDGIRQGLAKMSESLVIVEFLGSLIVQLEGFGAAFDTIKDSWDENIAPLFASMSEELAKLGEGEALQGITNVLKSLYTGFVTIITGIVLVLTGLLAGLINGLFEGASMAVKILTNVWNGIKTIWDGIKLVFAGVLQTAQGFNTGIKGVALFIADLIGFVGAFFKGSDALMQHFAGQILDDIDLIIEGAQNLGNGFVKMVEGAIYILGGLAQSLVSLIVGPLAILGAIIGGWVQGVIQFFQNLYDRLVGHSIVVDLVNTVQTLFTGMVTAVETTIAGWVQSIIKHVQNIYDRVTTKIEETKTAVETKFGEIRDKVETIMGEVVTKIITKGSEVLAEIKKPLEQALTDLAAMIPTFKTTGENILLGIKDGILAVAGELVTALIGSLEEAWSAATTWLDERSPSKRYAESGENIMKGYVVGVNKQKSALTQALVTTLQETDRAVKKRHDAINQRRRAEELSLRQTLGGAGFGEQGRLSGSVGFNTQAPQPIQPFVPPAYLPAAAQATNVDNSRSVSLSFGDTNVQGQQDIRLMVHLIREVIRDEMRTQI